MEFLYLDYYFELIKTSTTKGVKLCIFTDFGRYKPILHVYEPRLKLIFVCYLSTHEVTLRSILTDSRCY